MPEQLDIIGAIEECQIGDLLVRVAPIEPAPHPLGPAAAEPHLGIFATAPNLPAGWVVLFAHPATDPEDSLELLDEDARERTERLSILVGVSWRAISASVIGVIRSQESAITQLPPMAWKGELSQLRFLRSFIAEADPVKVATLIQMTAHWTSDPGGTQGPRFFT